MRVRSEAPHTRFARAEIRRVGVRMGSPSGTGALIGAGVGAVPAGLHVLIAPESFYMEAGSLAPFYVIFATGIGAGIGALIGSAAVDYDDYHPEGGP